MPASDKAGSLPTEGAPSSLCRFFWGPGDVLADRGAEPKDGTRMRVPRPLYLARRTLLQRQWDSNRVLSRVVRDDRLRENARHANPVIGVRHALSQSSRTLKAC